MTFEILTLAQGSAAWHQHRATALNASDAPAMLGISPYKSRAELVRERATGISPDVTPEQQRIFDRGHAVERLARPLAEQVIGEDLSPCVGTSGKFSASFDGITFTGDTAWESKTMNAALRDAIPNRLDGIPESGHQLPEHYRAQLEQQAMVSGCERILFTAASLDGDEISEGRHCWYTPDPAMRARLVAGWEQFEKDVAAYVPEDHPAPVTAAPMESLPAVVVQVQGALTIAGNLPAFGQALRAFIERIPQRPENDQQFADAEAACKALKKAEDALAQAEDGALAQISDVELMRRTVSDLKDLARRTRLATEKLVKAEKDARRTEKVMAARQAFEAHVARLQMDIKGVRLIVPMPDFGGSIKGLSSLASIDDKLTAALIAGKAEANTLASRIAGNLQTLDSVPQYAHLFADRQELAYKDAETLELLMQKRVDAEQARIEAERERIRLEEERKAREAAEREAEAERQRIRAEEQAKAQAEAQAQQAIQQTSAPAAAPAAQRAQLDADPRFAAVVAGSPAAPAPAPWDADEAATLKLGAINERLAPIALTEAGIRSLGIEANGELLWAGDEADDLMECKEMVTSLLAQLSAAKDRIAELTPVAGMDWRETMQRMLTRMEETDRWPAICDKARAVLSLANDATREPAAYLWGGCLWRTDEMGRGRPGAVELYRAQTPLTDADITALLPIWQQGSWTLPDYGRWVARAVERAHGIKTSPNLCLSCGHSINAHDRQYGCAEDGCDCETPNA